MASQGIRPRLRVAGRYVLQHEIAAGGMASVYLGKLCGPVGFSPIVAIKSLHPTFAKDPEFVQMFLDEARLAARIRHPNIVPVIDVHAEGDDLLLVLEYVHGESLMRLIAASRRAGSLPSPAVASAVLCDVLHGLHHAHDAKDERGAPLGIVHRDVSPQNVLVGADGVARVLDFGVAKAAGRVTTTRDGQVKGKFAYMAPEQLRGESVNRQADVYGAAVVLWETLTGERLFKGENEGNTVERVLFAPVSPPSSLRADLPASLDAVVMRGLSRERTQRFATAKEMAIALQAAVAPAAPPEVGEWVEARAIDALEQRSRLVAETQASVLPVTMPATGEDGSTSGQAVSEPPRAITSSPLAPAVEPRTGGGRVTLAVFAAITAMAALGLWISLRGHHGAPPVASGPPVESVAPALPAEPSAAAAQEPVPPSPPSVSVALTPTVPAKPSSSPHPVAGARPPGRGGKRAWPSPSTSAPSATAACSRRNADGEIVFDTECLRAREHTP